MTDENQSEAAESAESVSVSDLSAREAVDMLESASQEDAARVLAEESGGQNRSTVVQAATDRLDLLDGISPSEDGEERVVRRDAYGRVKHPWET